MEFQIHELHPAKQVLKIDSREIRLNYMTLDIDLQFKARYGGINELYETIQKEPTEVLHTIWILVIDKMRFNYDFEKFQKYVLTSQSSIVDTAKQMRELLNTCIRESMPIIRNKKRYEELNAIKHNQEDSKPCYARYYDTVASRYGYTLDQFYSLTLGQLHALLNVCGDKQYEELEVQAALAGKKLKPRMTFNDVSEEEETQQDDDAMAAFEELKKQYQENNKG